MSSFTNRTMRSALQTSNLLRRAPSSATRAFSVSSVFATTPPNVAPAPSPKPTTICTAPAVASKNAYVKSSRPVVSSGTGYARPASTNASPIPSRTADLANGLDDEPPLDLGPPSASGNEPVDWTRSYHGLSDAPFSSEAAEVLMAPLPMDDVEVKPDGIIYLPEIKYRRILNRAFGPGGWGLAPRGETIVTDKMVTREYALVVHGRLVSIARGEQDYFSPEGIPTATEGCKSNALMRCCKDLGVASELWDPRYIRSFLKDKAKRVWVEHVTTKKKKQIFLRKDDEVRYPFAVSKFAGASGA